ncbi:outer membrane receptor for ferric-pyochelin FptA, partial [marine sediment metagenome]
AEAAVFEQTRSLRNRDGSNSGVKTNGFELQMFYQGNDIWVNAAYSYLDARFDDSAAFQGTAQVIDALITVAQILLRARVWGRRRLPRSLHRTAECKVFLHK